MAKKDVNACLICGAPLVYLPEAKPMECAGCGRTFSSNAMCENGHFICDDCHRAPALVVIRRRCLEAKDTDPIALAEKLMQEPTVHMHGPEHHVLVGSALLTAYYNVTGKPGLEAALEKMQQRGKQVPGGTCGFFGCCGAAVSAGIFGAIVLESTPLSEETWGKANLLTSKCLANEAKVGGPRCCKRNTYLSILTAVQFCREELGVELPRPARTVCRFSHKCRECLGKKCPFFEE